MKNKIIAILQVFSMSLSFISCSTYNESLTNQNVISLSSSQTEFIDSIYFALSSVVLLESNDSCVVNSIDKILDIDDEYYILNTRKDEIVVFGKDGKFHRVINKVGRGPGEYIQLIDFAYDKYNDELLFLVAPSSIYHYTKYGDFIEKDKLDEYYSHISVDSSYYYYYYALDDIDSKHVIKCVNKISRTTHDLLDNEYNSASHCTFGSRMFQNENISFVKPFDNNIYELANGRISKITTLDLGTKIFNKANFKDGMDCTRLLNIGLKERTIYSFSRVAYSNDFIMFSSNLFDLNICQNGECKNYTRMRSAKYGNTLITYIPIQVSKDLKIAFIIDDFTISSYKKMFTESPKSKKALNPSFVNMIDNIKEGSNPILFIYELKQ